jgi:hypothetical protein
LIAALEVATRKVIGQTHGRHRNEEFRRFLNLADGEGACGVERENLTRLDHQLRAASWDDNELEDLELASAQLRQVQELFVRHARRGRDRQRSDDRQQRRA